MRRRPGWEPVFVGVLLGVWALLLAGADTVKGQTPPGAPDVEITTERLIFTWAPDGPLVVHMVQLVNVGPRPAEHVPLPVPEGAVFLDVPDELSAEPGVVTDPRPMAPGEGRQYIFGYALPWHGLPMPVRRPLFYPTDVLELWAEEALVLRGVGLQRVGAQELGGRWFDVYVSANLAPHPQWQVVVETAAGVAAAVSERERLGQRSDPVDILRTHPLPRWLGAAAVLLAVTVVLVRRQAGRQTSEAVSGGARGMGSGEEAGGRGRDGSAGGAEADRLKEAIVQLDVAFQNGELDKDVYTERRRGLRAQLSRLLAETRSAVGHDVSAGPGHSSAVPGEGAPKGDKSGEDSL